MSGWRCGTCHFEAANMNELACGHWSRCDHYARAAAEHTLPPIAERPRSDVPYHDDDGGGEVLCW